MQYATDDAAEETSRILTDLSLPRPYARKSVHGRRSRQHQNFAKNCSEWVVPTEPAEVKPARRSKLVGWFSCGLLVKVWYGP